MERSRPSKTPWYHCACSSNAPFHFSNDNASVSCSLNVGTCAIRSFGGRGGKRDSVDDVVVAVWVRSTSAGAGVLGALTVGEVTRAVGDRADVCAPASVAMVGRCVVDQKIDVVLQRQQP